MLTPQWRAIESVKRYNRHCNDVADYSHCNSIADYRFIVIIFRLPPLIDNCRLKMSSKEYDVSKDKGYTGSYCNSIADYYSHCIRTPLIDNCGGIS